MKFYYLLVFVLLISYFSLTESVVRLPSRRQSNSTLTKSSPHRLKSSNSFNTFTRKFSCVCGPYVPICDMIFAAIKIEFNIDVTATANTNNKGEYIRAQSTENYHLSNLLARIQSPSLKKLFTAIGLDTLSLATPALTISIGDVNGATFSGKLTYKSAQIDFQVVFIKDLHITFWAGMTLSFPSMVNSLKDVMNTQQKQLGTSAETMLGTFQSVSFTMVFQTGPTDFAKVPELEPALLRGVNKDLITASKMGLILLANIPIATIEGTAIGGWMKRVGIKNINLLARIQTDEFYADASLDEIKIGQHITLHHPGIYFKIQYSSPQTAEFGIQSEMSIVVGAKTLTFAGAVLFTPTDAGFKFAMRNLWDSAFGLSRLHFGRITLEMKLAYSMGVPTQFVLGGELAIGAGCYDENNKFKGKTWCLHSQAYAGINVQNPRESFLYLKSESHWNMQTIVSSMFGAESSGPKVPDFLVSMLDIHDGLILSFSPKKQTIDFKTYDEKGEVASDTSGVSIEAGFYFKGTVTLFSVTSSMVIRVNTQTENFVDFEGTIDVLNKISFGKVLVISEFDQAKDKGPIFSLKYLQGKIGVDVSCRVQIFEFNVGTKLVFEEGKLSFAFNAEWKYCPLMLAISVETTYSKLAMDKFHLKAEIKKNTNAQSFTQMISEVGAALAGSLTDLVQKLGQKIVDKVKKGWDTVKSWWKSWFGFRERSKNNYLATFADRLIKTDRALAERIANAYQKGIKVMVDIEEISFSIDYDDAVACEVEQKVLIIGARFKGVLMDNPIDFEGEIDLFSRTKVIVSFITWALKGIEHIFSKKDVPKALL